MEFIRWASFVGLSCDLAGFGLLAYDVAASIRSERAAWEEVPRVKRAGFNHRYAFLAPGADRRAEEQAQFDQRETKERSAVTSAQNRRRIRVMIGISAVLVGFALQMVGAYPR